MTRYLFCYEELNDHVENKAFAQVIYDDIERIIIERDDKQVIVSLSENERKELWLIPDGCGLCIDDNGLCINTAALNDVLEAYIQKVALFVLERLLRKVVTKQISCNDNTRLQFEFILNYTRTHKIFPLLIDIKKNKAQTPHTILISKAEKEEFVNILEVELHRAILKLSDGYGVTICLAPNFLKKIGVVINKNSDKQDNGGCFFKTAFNKSVINLNIRYPMIRGQFFEGLTLSSIVENNSVSMYTCSKKRFYTQTGFTQLKLKNSNIKDIVKFEVSILLCQLVIWVLRNHKMYCSSVFQYLKLSNHHHYAFHAENIKLSKTKPNDIFDKILKQQGFEREALGIYYVRG